MKDMLAHFKDYFKQAGECERVAKLATDDAKRELFARLAERYRVLADEVERAARNEASDD
jgi:hypothetical protein